MSGLHSRTATTSFSILAADFGNTTGVSTSAGTLISAALFTEEGLQSLAVVGGGEASGDLDITLSLSQRTAGEEAILASDVLALDGTFDNVIVLQLTYNEATAVALFGSETDARLGWLDEGQWVLAIAGNTGTAGSLAGFYDKSYAAFLADEGGGVFDSINMLGAHGVDTAVNTVWAVINHNSDFSTVGAVPEPATGVLFILGAGALMFSNRKRKIYEPHRS